MSYIKPPLGVNPYWYNVRNRINELTEGIQRYNNFEEFNTKHAELIKTWANEIILQCDIYIKYKQVEEKYNKT